MGVINNTNRNSTAAKGKKVIYPPTVSAPGTGQPTNIYINQNFYDIDGIPGNIQDKVNAVRTGKILTSSNTNRITSPQVQSNTNVVQERKVQVNNVPQSKGGIDYTNTKRSFINKISDAIDNHPLASFTSFPNKISFINQEEDEKIILMVRQHPAIYIPQLIVVLGLLIAAFLFPIFVSAMGFGEGSGALAIGFVLFFILVAITVIFNSFVKWFYTVNIVTDQRIVDVDFVSIMHHEVSEAQLERIEDVTQETAGFLGTVFDYGNVYIQTAGSKPEFDFMNVPRPRDIQDTLFDLMEMKQNNN